MSKNKRKITTFEKLEEKRNTFTIIWGSLGLLLRLALVGLLGLLLDSAVTRLWPKEKCT